MVEWEWGCPRRRVGDGRYTLCMGLFSILGALRSGTGEDEAPLPEFIASMEDIGPVRVVRLRGPVGKEIAEQHASAVQQAQSSGERMFARPVLFDFRETTAWDFATVAFLVQALRRRMESKAPVGIVNAPSQLVAEL